MSKCLSERCDNDVKGRRYCCGDCKVAQRNLRENGPTVEETMPRYKEVDRDVDLLDKGAWLMFTKDHTDEHCVADFMRIWKRAPEHVIPDGHYKFVGPVWDEEELTWRWKDGAR